MTINPFMLIQNFKLENNFSKAKIFSEKSGIVLRFCKSLA